MTHLLPPNPTALSTTLTLNLSASSGPLSPPPLLPMSVKPSSFLSTFIAGLHTGLPVSTLTLLPSSPHTVPHSSQEVVFKLQVRTCHPVVLLKTFPRFSVILRITSKLLTVATTPYLLPWFQLLLKPLTHPPSLPLWPSLTLLLTCWPSFWSRNVSNLFPPQVLHMCCFFFVKHSSPDICIAGPLWPLSHLLREAFSGHPI